MTTPTPLGAMSTQQLEAQHQEPSWHGRNYCECDYCCEVRARDLAHWDGIPGVSPLLTPAQVVALLGEELAYYRLERDECEELDPVAACTWNEKARILEHLARKLLALADDAALPEGLR